MDFNCTKKNSIEFNYWIKIMVSKQYNEVSFYLEVFHSFSVWLFSHSADQSRINLHLFKLFQDCTDDNCCAMGINRFWKGLSLSLTHSLNRFCRMVFNHYRNFFCYHLKIASYKFDFVTPSKQASKQWMYDDDVGKRNSTSISTSTNRFQININVLLIVFLASLHTHLSLARKSEILLFRDCELKVLINHH